MNRRSYGSGSLRRRTPGGPWWARWRGAGGKRIERSTATTDQRMAARILAAWTGRANLVRSGLATTADESAATAGTKPVAVHLTDWRATLLARGRTDKHVELVHRRAAALLQRAGVVRLADVSPSRIERALGELRDAGRALQTLTHYVRAIKEFVRWAYDDNRLHDNPLRKLGTFNAAPDRRYQRRALGAGEVDWLLRVTAGAPTWRGIGGPDRAMLYRLAAGTGFRRAELASLTPESFDLDAKPATVTVKARSSKRRREDEQPIRGDLAATLRPWLAKRPAGVAVFRLPDKTAMMLRADLRRSKAAWIRATRSKADRRARRADAFLDVAVDGRLVDLHALRVTYITDLIRGGASIAAAQRLARHSDPKLTVNVYTRLGLFDLAGALEALPGRGKKRAVRTTG